MVSILSTRPDRYDCYSGRVADKDSPYRILIILSGRSIIVNKISSAIFSFNNFILFKKGTFYLEN